ncbi:hydroxymethylbilane synthase [Apibacter mensalis]|uniref:Hydroxymethylbilane synthase n=1 Tax=Apibacter mensalis TaxID=1586267 RepID=A0A0X3AR25_9FLAO|nr:hydroxymethylbilane synthase [Apibacter mensalis]CVK16338.1 hydroxymethylbilane synthase [Apibacter mensalis]
MSLIRIGTRNSPLAMWQALEVENKIRELGYQTEIIPITSCGDKNLTQPLYQMDIIGVFTRDLDIALLNDKIDVAVHSLKDVPTLLPKGIFLSAVLERDYEADILVRNPNKWDKKGCYKNLYLGTGSLRRRAFWKAKFPEVTFGNIRGNVQTRLSKLESEGFDGTIFSLAGIKRLGLSLDYELLDFIIPAPAQGVVGVTSMDKNKELTELLRKINHKDTQICIEIERDFLNKIEGGCTAPIGALARIENNHIIFKAGIVSLDGNKKILLHETFTIAESSGKGSILALKAKKMGAEEIINEIKAYRE